MLREAWTRSRAKGGDYGAASPGARSVQPAEAACLERTSARSRLVFKNARGSCEGYFYGISREDERAARLAADYCIRKKKVNCESASEPHEARLLLARHRPAALALRAAPTCSAADGGQSAQIQR